MSQTLQERIRERAYHIWNGSGRPDGRDEQFWLQAEREIVAETATASTSATTVPTAPAEEPAALAATAVTAAPTVTAAPAEEPAAKKAPKKAARLVAKAKAAAAKRTSADAIPLVEATSIVPLPGQPTASAVPAAPKTAAAKPAATLAAKAAPKSAAKPRLRAAR